MENLFIPPFSEQLLLKRKKIKRELISQKSDWIDKKIAYLALSQMKNAEKLVNKGWTVFDSEHPFIKEAFL